MLSDEYSKFCSGDIVVTVKDINIGRVRVCAGSIGKVLNTFLGRKISVEFESYIQGHTCGGVGKDGHCLWVNDIYLDIYSGDRMKLDIGDLI